MSERRLALAATLLAAFLAGCGGPEVACADHEDDDGDGFVDCDDQDCATACTGASPDGVENNGAACVTTRTALTRRLPR